MASGLNTSLPPPSTSSLSRSRSSSPQKPSESTYRMRTLLRAGIYVDVDVPEEVKDQINIALQTPPTDAATLERLVSKLQHVSMELTAAQAGETEWTDLLYEIVKGLKPINLLVARNRDWRPDIKPRVHQPSVPQKRLCDTSGAVDSSVKTSAQAPMTPFYLKNPRPDISVGISDRALANILQSRQVRNAKYLLNDLQETRDLISDPGVNPLSLRFPFFLVEAKSGATGSNLYQAQNQAAVGGASAIEILKGLYKACDSPVLNTAPPSGVNTAHCWNETDGSYCMANIDMWRTTRESRASDFVSKISSILNWGSGTFQTTILEKLSFFSAQDSPSTFQPELS
ncbi:hypothetical protein P170DRAFT_447332 [Aspergillus steynii IBT 23096]|uniref:DUF7924 domain-containing protein n=1 Tax=Aspergillus steynii IBT 23096 TaxID=1392250 RepID=A0A2I2GA21_9EURO|nr:uncharacterized protein P170DRAFT_447332 [Aspergillus steynii IBT 23096]PLB49729.1 hypothetical protein P170DRAFT_447332 [Aspergillus steynii IBT 23096]